MIQITIIGLGRIGASMGLALRRNPGANFTVVGHDREPTAAGLAERAGAVSRIEWNLPRACETADVLLLALPLNEIRETLALAAPYLKSGVVALDTAPLKRPVLQWAAELLPDGCHFVGANPLLSPERLHDRDYGPAAARADLFDGGMLALVPPRGAPPEAVKLGRDLAHLLGAAPYFLEAAEHDSLMASADALPGLLAVALIRAATASPGWRDIRRLADRTFATASAAGLRSPAALHASLMLNRENTLRALDAALAELAALRQAIAGAGGDSGPSLDALLSEAAEKRERWRKDRQESGWQAARGPEIEMPGTARVLGQSLGLGEVLRRRKGSERKQ